ncbi:hypothetical protein, partial [Pseudoalteromonas sp. Z9A6]
LAASLALSGALARVLTASLALSAWFTASMATGGWATLLCGRTLTIMDTVFSRQWNVLWVRTLTGFH